MSDYTMAHNFLSPVREACGQAGSRFLGRHMLRSLQLHEQVHPNLIGKRQPDQVEHWAKRWGSLISSSRLANQECPKFSKVQPHARADPVLAAGRTRPARPTASHRQATAFIRQMKKPDEGWPSRIM